MTTHVFDPDVVHACALRCLGKSKPEMFDAFADAMEEHYPGVLDRGQPWIYSIAGGAMIQMKLYYASLGEYIMIWGTPIGSEGHSGRHLCGFWDTVIDGETWYYGEGQFEKTVYRPGDRIYVGPGEVRGMNFTDGVWAVEYERGPLPTSIPFGLADVSFSCLDWLTAAQTVSLYADLVCQSLSRSFKEAPLGLGAPAAAVTGAVSSVARKLTWWLQPPRPSARIPRDNRPWRFGTSSAADARVHAAGDRADELHGEAARQQPFHHKGEHAIA
jgi:C-8 sterol isomerase